MTCDNIGAVSISSFFLVCVCVNFVLNTFMQCIPCILDSHVYQAWHGLLVSKIQNYRRFVAEI